MAVDGIKRLSVLGAVGVSVVFAAYNGWLSSRHLAPDGVLFITHRFVVIALLATWLVADAQERQRAIFDHGHHAFFLFFVYAPYYLISTRRGRAVHMLAGMGFLFLLPQIAELTPSLAGMAVVLALVVVALVVYLSTTSAGFGVALRYCLLGPAIVIFLGVAILFFDLLPPSPLDADIGAVLVVATCVELFPLGTAAVRLVRTPGLRTRRNVFTFVIAGLSLVPAVAVYLSGLVAAG